MGPINNIPTLVQVMAWRRPGAKPLSEQAPSHYLNQWWLDYRRIYASLGLNELRTRSIWYRSNVVLYYMIGKIASGQHETKVAEHKNTTCHIKVKRLRWWFHTNTIVYMQSILTKRREPKFNFKRMKYTYSFYAIPECSVVSAATLPPPFDHLWRHKILWFPAMLRYGSNHNIGTIGLRNCTWS